MSRKPSRTLADIRPGQLTIRCLHCEQLRAAAGAVKFRAHLVCAECAEKLRATAPG